MEKGQEEEKEREEEENCHDSEAEGSDLIVIGEKPSSNVGGKGMQPSWGTAQMETGQQI